MSTLVKIWFTDKKKSYFISLPILFKVQSIHLVKFLQWTSDPLWCASLFWLCHFADVCKGQIAGVQCPSLGEPWRALVKAEFTNLPPLSDWNTLTFHSKWFSQWFLMVHQASRAWSFMASNWRFRWLDWSSREITKWCLPWSVIMGKGPHKWSQVPLASPASVKFQTLYFTHHISPRSTSLTVKHFTSQRRSPDWSPV